MEDLYGKLLNACREGKTHDIERLLQEVKTETPEVYVAAQKKVCEYLKLADRQNEGIEEEIVKPIKCMAFQGLVEIAISMLAVIPEDHDNQNE